MECGNTEQTIIPGTPADVGGLRRQLIIMLLRNMEGSPAAQWQGGFQAPINPMQKAGMNSIYNKMGGGIQTGRMASAQPEPPPRPFQGSPQEQMLRAMMAQRMRGGA